MKTATSQRAGATEEGGLDAGVDAVDAAGFVTGWARQAGPGPAVVQIRLKREVLAEARAALFRGDLLRRGVGHGHYGFRARLRQVLAPGRHAARLCLAGRAVPVRLAVPAIELRRPVTVEALLHEPPGWTARDVLEAPRCLSFGRDLEAMGAGRFVDMMFHFALRRWPAAHEGRFYAGLLRARALTPEALLAELLGGRERADLDPALVSPWHPEFPFPAAAEGMA